MNETKKTIYALEDIYALGTQLPVAAFQKLYNFTPTIDTEDDFALQLIKTQAENFIDTYAEDYAEKDERALRNAFARQKRKTPDLLHEYRQRKETLKYLPN